MTVSAAQADAYYDSLTDYINANSGLDALSVDQVKMVWRTHKKMKHKLGQETHPTNNPCDKRTGKRCIARKSNGEPCRMFPVPGASVCKMHGGAVRHVQNSARARLANAADRLAKELLGMATDPNISEAVRLAAIKDALSRGGITEKTEVTVTAKAFEQVFEQMETSSLAAFRGEPVEIEPQHEIESSEDALEVEIIDAEEERWPLPEHQTDDERGSPFDSGPQPNPFTGPLGPTGPAGSGLMTLEDAVATQRAITRRATRR